MREFEGPKTQPQTPTHNIGLLVVVLTAITTTLVTAMIMLGPLLVLLATDFGVTVGQVGQLQAASALPWALTALLAGPLCDRYGRRPVLMFSLGGLGLTTAAASLAPSLPALFALRVATGLLGGCGPTALLSTIGDRIPIEKRGSAVGWVFSGFGFAAVAGIPAVGALGGYLGWRWAFALVGLVVLIFVVVARLLVPPDPANTGRGRFGGGYGAVLRLPALGRTLLTNLSERVMYAAVTLYLAAFLIQSYALSTVQAAPFLTVAALGTVGGNVFGGRLADRLYRPRVFALAQLVAAALVLALFGEPRGLAISAALAAALGVANAASRPSLLTLASELSEAHRGTAMGILSFSTQLGWAFASAAGGAALGIAGYPGLGWLCAVVAIGGALIVPGLWSCQPRAR